MPELLPDGLPARLRGSKFDFSQWADGRAWKFLQGQDYDSSLDTFRANLKKWAKRNGYKVEVRAMPALDEGGRPLPLAEAEPVGAAVKFSPEAEG